MLSRISTIHKTIIYIFLVSCTTSSLLAERWYEIEVILFEQATEERLVAESWERMPPLPDISTSRDIISLPPHLQPLTSLCVNGRLFNVKQLPTPEEVTLDLALTDPTPDDIAEQQNDTFIGDQEPQAEQKEIELPFQLLTPEQRQLKNVYQQLRRRRGYRMLFHEAWRQPMSRKRDSQPIRIYAGKNYADQFNYAGDALVELAESDSVDTSTINANYLSAIAPLPQPVALETRVLFDQNKPIHAMMDIDEHFKITEADKARERINQCAAQDQEQMQNQRDAVWQIEGYLKIYAERFRHVETNLVVRIPGQEEVDLRAIATNLAAEEMVASFDLSENSVQSSYDWQFDDDFLNPAEDKQTLIRDVLKHYSMQQSRRIIDEKIHYLDHPLLGMIVQMRRYDPEQDEDEI